MKILIVDDEPDVVAGLARNLQLADFDVATAPDGREAVAKCRSWKPDALLMDIRMPHLNGMDACREIQREQPEILVILMTGFSEALDEANQHIFARACENQQVELMMKPIDLDEVIALIRSGEIGQATEIRVSFHPTISTPTTERSSTSRSDPAQE